MQMKLWLIWKMDFRDVIAEFVASIIAIRAGMMALPTKKGSCRSKTRDAERMRMAMVQGT